MLSGGKAVLESHLERVQQTVIQKAGDRIRREITETQKKELRRIISQGVADGLSPAALGQQVRDWSGWDEYAAERIARTETMFAYNDTALSEYASRSVTRVEAVDGDKDDVCALRNGQIYDVQEAYGIQDHPNGTLDWIPVVD